MSEKRSVHTDALETLGTIITDGGRDAIHLAVEPVIAGEKLWPGQDIGLKDGKAYNQISKLGGKYVGIVDPFLKGAINEGQKFWLVVYPRTITSLRHVWEHPDFNGQIQPATKSVEELKKKASEKWLRNYADEVSQNYETIMRYAQTWVDDDYGDCICEGDRYEGECVPSEFWEHFKNVTGQVPKDAGYGSPNFFSCSC